MSLPSSIKIGHLSYQVVVNNDLVNDYSVRQRGVYAGYSSPSEQVIALADQSPGGKQFAEDYRREVLLHEILHQCLRVSGCDPDRDTRANVEDVEERVVEAVAGPLLETLRRSPELVSYLLTGQEVVV